MCKDIVTVSEGAAAPPHSSRRMGREPKTAKRPALPRLDAQFDWTKFFTCGREHWRNHVPSFGP